MNPNTLDELSARLVTGWDEAFGARILFALLGAVILVFTVRALVRRESSLVIAALWLLAGLAFAGFSLQPQRIVTFAVRIPYMTRTRTIIGTLSVVVLLTTLEAIRRTHLQERYALLWVATALVLLIAAVFPPVVALLRALTGTDYATAVVAVAFTFLVLVAFHFSISFSAGQVRQTRMAQRIALLETRLRALESRDGDERAIVPAGETPPASGSGTDRDRSTCDNGTDE
jgi:hypothetical protein